VKEGLWTFGERKEHPFAALQGGFHMQYGVAMVVNHCVATLAYHESFPIAKTE